MKVTKKVGRRSRSSISRRKFRSKKNKKSSYKKRYGKTHRGGARSRKYGHKRGKRFHRGGVGEFNCEQFTDTFERHVSLAIGHGFDGYGYGGMDPEATISYNNNTKYKNYRFELTFKKIDQFSFTQATENFALKVDLKDLSKYKRNMEVVLERLTGGGSDYPSFRFTGTLNEILENFVNPETWKSITEYNGLRKYNFNLGSNIETFRQIADCLRSLLQKLQESERQERQAQADLEKRNRQAKEESLAEQDRLAQQARLAQQDRLAQ